MKPPVGYSKPGEDTDFFPGWLSTLNAMSDSPVGPFADVPVVRNLTRDTIYPGFHVKCRGVDHPKLGPAPGQDVQSLICHSVLGWVLNQRVASHRETTAREFKLTGRTRRRKHSWSNVVLELYSDIIALHPTIVQVPMNPWPGLVPETLWATSTFYPDTDNRGSQWDLSLAHPNMSLWSSISAVEHCSGTTTSVRILPEGLQPWV